MRSERRAVLQSDLFLALLAAGSGLFVARDAPLSAPLVAVVMAGLTAGALYLVEHDRVPGLFPEVAALASLLGLLGVGAAFVAVLSAPVDVVSATALAGSGIGLLCYRIIFGLVRPVPAFRLEKQSGDDEP